MRSELSDVDPFNGFVGFFIAVEITEQTNPSVRIGGRQVLAILGEADISYALTAVFERFDI